MRSSSTPRRRATWTAVAAGALLLLTGCADVHPGVAAKVGDDTITMATVDQAADDLCTGLRPQLGTGQTPASVTMGRLRSNIVQTMVTRQVAEQVAADLDVSTGPSYDDAVNSAKTSVANLPAEVRQTLIDLQTAGPYVTDVLTAAAKKQLAAAGNTSPTDEQVNLQATGLLAGYMKKADISIDPRFGLDADLGTTDTTVSFAASSVAKTAAKAVSSEATQDDVDAALALVPMSLRCSK